MDGSSQNRSDNQNMCRSSRQPSVSSPMTQTVPPSPFDQWAVPSPHSGASEMTIFHAGHAFSASPAPMPSSPARSPYPTHRPIERQSSTTSSTEFIPRTLDPSTSNVGSEYEEFLAWKEQRRQATLREQAMQNQQLQNQRLQQPQSQNSPYMSYSGSVGPLLPRLPGHMVPIPQNDGGGYGSPYENLGREHGLPGAGSHSVSTRGGHCYGPVSIKGDARIVRGNVVDTVRPYMKAKDHTYAGRMYVEGNALVWDGDQTVEAANTFWHSGTIGSGRMK